MDHRYTPNIIEICNLKTYFYTDDGIVKAVDGVDLAVRPGEVLGLVGESGCGKSVMSFSILRLVPPPGKILEGEIFFGGKDLLKISENEMMSIRGSQISMIFQQPQASLDPMFKIGEQLVEVLQIHQNLNKTQARERAVELLRDVGIPDPETKAHAYSFELSGGQAQRVMIAMALALNPQLLIADEPTTALDVTIQAQILDLMRMLRSEFNMSMILITHDLGVIAETADRIAVMYAGRIVEQADVQTLFARPLHPYTHGLISSIPVLGKVQNRLEVIPGIVPNLIDMPPGCKFAPRCLAMTTYNLAACQLDEPPLATVQSGHIVRCWLYLDHGAHQAPLTVTRMGSLPT